MSLTKPGDVACLPEVPARYVFDRLLRARLATTTRPGMVIISVAEFVSALARTGLEATRTNLNVAPLYTSLGWTVHRSTTDYCFLSPQLQTVAEYETEGLASPESVLDVPRTALFIFDNLLRSVLAEATPEIDWHFVSMQRYKSALFVSLGAARAARLDARWFEVDQAYRRTGLWAVRTVTEGDEDKQGYYFRPARDDAGEDGTEHEDPVLPFPYYALPATVLRAVDAFIHACAAAGDMPVLSASTLRTILDAPRISPKTADRILDAIVTEYKLFWDIEIETTDAAGRVLRFCFPPEPTAKPVERRPVSPLDAKDGEPCLVLDAANEQDDEHEATPVLQEEEELGDDLPALA